MCNRLNLEARIKKIEKRSTEAGAFKPGMSTIKEINVPKYYYSLGFNHQDMCLLSKHGFEIMSWGLIPPGLTEIKKRNGMLNARAEDIFTKKSYQIPILHNRCLLPVTGFFEFRTINNTSYPYYIYKPGKEEFCMGCIYTFSQNPDTQKWEKSFSIITTPANNLLKKIHNEGERMPLILPDDYWASWLDSSVTKESEIKEMMQPYFGDLHAHTISQDINHTRFKDNNRLEILSEKEYDIPPVYTRQKVKGLLRQEYSDTIQVL